MHVSYWLLPFKDDAAPLQAVIDALASTYDAPRFRPHVTLYSGMGDPEEAARLVRSVGERAGILTLGCRPLAHSEVTAKTLFVPFASTPEIGAMARYLQTSVAAPGGYAFAPHLSLLYKRLPAAERHSLTTRLAAPLESVRFDAVEAVCTDSDIDSKTDVEAWRRLAWARLAGVD